MRTNQVAVPALIRTIVVALACGLLASSAAAQTHAEHLIAAPLTKSVTLPNGSVVAIPMWGFARDANDNGILDAGEAPTVPGPRITVAPGDTTLAITLTNALPPGAEAVSVVVPGQAFSAAPVRDGAGRIVSMSAETAVGGTSVYTFTNVKSGTFLYHSGTHPAVQVQMGLYGAVTKDAAVGAAYGGVWYAHEALLVYSEIDVALHTAVANGTYGTSPGPTSTIDYAPSLFLINGESYTAAGAAMDAGVSGERTLIRLLNAGLKTHVPQLDNGVLSLVAEDGNAYPFARPQAGVMLAAGKTQDAIWTPPTGGTFAIYDRMLNLAAQDQGAGGMLAKLRVGASASDAPAPVSAVGDSYSATEDTPRVVPVASGVLMNDAGTALRAQLVTNARGGTVVLNANGSFTYTPLPNFFGVDSFTYRVVSANNISDPAMVTITVAGVADAPVALAQAIDVEARSSVNVTLAGTDGDGDPLRFYLTSLPTHGTLSYINPLTSAETPLGAANLHTGLTAATLGTAIPSGHVIYTPTKVPVYVGADSFRFVASDAPVGSVPPLSASSFSAAVTVSATVLPLPTSATPPGAPLALTVAGTDGAPISAYRWTLEEDRMYEVMPGVADPNTVSVNFHASYMPVVQSGTEAAPPQIEPLKRYFLSVLPTDGGYTNSGITINRGQTAATVKVQKGPLPTAQVRVRVFEDNASLNGMWDSSEAGLPGFQVTIDDAGGRYGMSGGHQSTDAFGNPIGTVYADCPSAGTCDAFQVASRGDGFVLTDSDGYALIQNLPPGKYTVKVRAPGGQTWIQTSTIEGQPGIDAWVKSNEPQFFSEFGPPGPHVFVGFVRANVGSGGVGTGPYKIAGRVTNLHMSRPPDARLFSGAPFDFSTPWVALNASGVGGALLYTQPTAEDGTFEISGVPSGSYQLVVFDSALDIIISTKTVNVSDGDIAMGDVPVFQWFSRLYNYVFSDTNQNGFREQGEVGIPEQNVNIRWRDGSIYQAAPTDRSGFVPFEEVFPFFAWLVADVDFARFKATGVTVVVDNGGDPTVNTSWAAQVGADLDPQVLSPQPQAENGGAPYRTETGSPLILLEGFQSFLGQSQVMLWGKAPYAEPGSSVPDVNVAPFDGVFPGVGDVDGNGNGRFDVDTFHGGITGVVHYSTTRAENDPRWGTPEPWEPGVPNVRLQLWDETRTHLLNEVVTDSWDASQPTGCQGEVYSYLGVARDCYDGLRNFNQARPAVFDGGYYFSTELSNRGSLPGHEYDLPLDQRDVMKPLRPGKYVVKLVVPDGYKVVKEEDKNVDFGEEYIPAQFYLTGQPLSGDPAASALTAPITSAAGSLHVTAGDGAKFQAGSRVSVDTEVMLVSAVAGDTLTVTRAQAGTLAEPHAAAAVVAPFESQPAATVEEYPLYAPFCVGTVRDVPAWLALFPGVPGTYAGEQRPLCDAKLVTVQDGANPAANFFLFTEAPVAGHVIGFVLDDTTNEFDPNAPNFGEKYAPPFMPVAFRDWTGREVARTYTDQYGVYNALVPSTFTAAVPQPSGMSPSMITACINSPTMPGPNGTFIAEPHFHKEYTHFCYTMQFMPGTTSYLDTPVMPTGAFTGTGTFPVDAELPHATPVIASVNGPLGIGPYIVDSGAAARTITITSAGTVPVPNPAYDGAGGRFPKLIARDYGFGAGASLNQAGFVTLNGTRIPYSAWTTNSITAAVPAGASYRTGELAIERCLGGKTGATNTITGTCLDKRKSVVGITLNVATTAMHAARPPKVVAPGQTIQSVIDAATPGDLILVPAGVFEEMVVMSKPVRLQGAGAASTLINVVTTPSENLQAWLDRTGSLLLSSTDYLLPNQTAMTPPPFQAGDVANVLGGEGAGVTVLGRNQPTALGRCPTPSGSSLATNFVNATNEAYCLHNENYTVGGGLGAAVWRPNARIDGFSIVGANSAAGIMVNGYNRYLEISNNKIYNNTGDFAGGIRVGHPGATPPLVDDNAHNTFLSVHHNQITQNAGIGANGGGAVVFGTGSGGYKLTDNFIAGNFTAGQGAGVAHIGNAALPTLSADELERTFVQRDGGNVLNGGLIDNNTVVFNESFSQGVAVNGGGLFIGGTPPPVGAVTTGSGPVTVSNNLVLGNQAAAGDGGGVALLGVNGTDVQEPVADRYHVNFYNNVIVNNEAALAGGGIALQDAAYVNIVHNTIARNDSLATAGAAFTVPGNSNQSVPQPAGIVSRGHSAALGTLTGGFSNPLLVNSILWQNRSFYFGQVSGGIQVPGVPNATPPTYGLIANAANPNWDLGVLGAPGSARLNPTYSVLTSTAGYGGANNVSTPPPFVASYYNQDRRFAYQQAEVTTIQAPAAFDEGGNFIRPQFGPLSLQYPGTGAFLGNYHVANGVDGQNLNTLYAGASVPGAVLFDIDTDPRPPSTPHRGADQHIGGAPPLAVNDVATTNAGVPVTVSVLTNDTGTSLVVTGVGFPANGTATFTATNVTYTPNAGFIGVDTFLYTISGVGGPASASVTVTVNPTQPVLSLAPASVAFGNQNVNATSAPQVVTVRNTGSAPLTITLPMTLGGTNANQFALPSTNCGATLAVGATCTVSVTFTPTTVGDKSGTVNVTVAAPATSGSVTLTGTGVAAAGPTIAAVVSANPTTLNTTVTSPSITPAPNTLLVAFVSADAPATGANTVVNSVTNSGTVLTWTNAVRSNTQRGTAEVWWAYTTPAHAAMTVTAALNQSEARSMTVVAFTGAASSLAGAASAIANAASGAPTGSVLITRDNSLVFAVGVDWDSPRTMVPGPSQTSINQYTPTVGDTYWVQRSNTAIPAAGTNVTMSDTYTAPMTDRWNLAVIEIRVP